MSKGPWRRKKGERGEKPQEPWPEVAPAGDTTRDLAWAQVQTLKKQLEAGASIGTPANQLASLNRAYTSALNTHAKLAGEGELTEATICRSKPFQIVLADMYEILKEYPAAARAIAKRLGDLGRKKKK
jgi:hypothetical protein